MKVTKKIIILCAIFIAILTINTKVNAAYANIKSDKTKMMVGDTATITVSVEAAAWNIKVSGAATMKEADSTSDGENTKKTFTTTFKGSKPGTYDVKLSGDISDGSTMKTQNISGNVKIVVEEEEREEKNNSNSSDTNNNSNPSSRSNSGSNSERTKSSDATLRNLGFTPNDFSGFKKQTTVYNAQVPNSTDKINIYAKASDSNATVSGTGTKTLEVGRNSFSVKVTAEDNKTTKTYTINVTRKEKEEENSKDDQKEENKEEEKEENKEEKMALGVYKLELIAIKENGEEEELELNKEFERTGLDYICDVPEDVKKVSVKTEAYDYNDSVKVDGADSELKNGENLILITVGNGTDTITYKITINKGNKEIASTQPQEENIQEEAKKENLLSRLMNAKGLIIGGVVFLVVIEILIIIYLRLTKPEKNKKEKNKVKNNNDDNKEAVLK